MKDDTPDPQPAAQPPSDHDQRPSSHAPIARGDGLVVPLDLRAYQSLQQTCERFERLLQAQSRYATAIQRDIAGQRRDLAARQRDRGSDERDRQAEARDELSDTLTAIADTARGSTEGNVVLRARLDRRRAADDRGQAAEQRAHATHDRQLAADERALSAQDRAAAVAEQWPATLGHVQCRHRPDDPDDALTSH